MSKEKEILFSIGDFDVRKESTYVVRHKPDTNAPSGFQEKGATKVPSAGIGESFQFQAVGDVWDTGFYDYSPCYSIEEDKASVKKIAKQRKDNVLVPYLQSMGMENDPNNHSNDEFWGGRKQNFFIEYNQVIDTKNPRDVMTLYAALLSLNIAPKGQESNPLYDRASYVVVDTTKALKLKEERAENKFQAIANFATMLKTDKTGLLNCMDYLGIRFSRSAQDSALMSIFDEYLSSGQKTISEFNDLVTQYNDHDFKIIVDIHNHLKEGYMKNSKVSKNGQGMFTYDGEVLGPDLKTSAEIIRKQHPDIVREMLLEDDNK